MFWVNAYTKFLETEVKRLQEENRILVSSLLERSGHKEAAYMLRSDNPEAQKVAVTKAEQIGTASEPRPEQVPMSRAGWRDRERRRYRGPRCQFSMRISRPWHLKQSSKRKR